MISKSVKDHLNKNSLKTPNDFMVVIETNSEILKPIIKVDGIDEIEVDVQIPEENESKEGIKRKIFIPKVHGRDEIDVEKLDSAIKEVLDQFDSPELFPNNEDISEMITKSVMDYLDKNELKEADDVTLVIKPNSNILEPKIKIDGNEEIKVGVLLPDDENETVKETKRKIFAKKVHGTDTIDVQQFNSAVREVLDSSRKSETPVPSSETLDYEIEGITTIPQDLDELGHSKFQKEVC